MMLIKLFLFFLLLLILPDMYIYKAYIRRVSQKWTHWAYWLPSLFLLLGMTLVFSIHEPRPDSMQRLSNFLLIFLCFSVPKALFVIVILFMKLLYIISKNINPKYQLRAESQKHSQYRQRMHLSAG